jgi:hypothetical protein
MARLRYALARCPFGLLHPIARAEMNEIRERRQLRAARRAEDFITFGQEQFTQWL